jgi:PAS domain S-box-containing protein
LRPAASRRLPITADLLANVLRKLPQPFLLVDRQGRPVIWNQALEDLTGQSSARLTELGLPDLLGNLGEELLPIVEQVTETGQSYGKVFEWKVRAGETTPIEIHAVRVESPEGDSLALLALKNLSERQRLENCASRRRWRRSGNSPGESRTTSITC